MYFLRVTFETGGTREITRGENDLAIRRSYGEFVLMQKWLSNHEPLITTAAVAKWLGIAPRTVCLWAECQEIPAIKIGRQWRFRESELREWLQNPGSKVKVLAV
jgi:excisionase family DNA binding protein